MKISCLVLCCASLVAIVFASKCEEERDKAKRSGLIGAFVPSCEEDGSYSAMQCHGSTGYCHCAEEDGTPINKPARGKYAACECPRARAKATKHHLKGAYHPRCQKNGKWAVRQCWWSKGSCWCVHEDTGVKFSNNPRKCYLNCYLNCY